MKKTFRGGSKIFVTVAIVFILGTSAIMFGYGGDNVQEIKNETGQRASNMIEEHGASIVENVVDSTKEKVGETLKEVGEKILEEESEWGYYGNYGDDVNEYEKVVLFFTAAWCPSCTDAEKNIESERRDIPRDIAIIKVDFDAMEELKQQYVVSKQHTFVLVDVDGKEIKKWIGSKTLSEIIDNIK